MVDVTIGGARFDASSSHFSLSITQLQDMAELKKLRLFSDLRSASFAGTNLNDVGLAHVARVRTIDNLNLQDTEISDAGLACLERLPNLQHLRLKGNPQLTNACVPHLARLTQLVDLQIHETSITEAALTELAGLAELRGVSVHVWQGNYTFDGLLALSVRMPGCAVLAKGHGEFLDGTFYGEWRE